MMTWPQLAQRYHFASDIGVISLEFPTSMQYGHRMESGTGNSERYFFELPAGTGAFNFFFSSPSTKKKALPGTLTIIHLYSGKSRSARACGPGRLAKLALNLGSSYKAVSPDSSETLPARCGQNPRHRPFRSHLGCTSYIYLYFVLCDVARQSRAKAKPHAVGVAGKLAF